MTAGKCVAWALIGCWALLVTSSQAAEWVDLSYTFDKTTQYWPGFLHFNLTETFRGQKGTFWLETHDFEASEHGGTHMDAPSHFSKGGWTLDQIPADHFIAHAALLDIEERSQNDLDTVVTPDDLAAWKSEHGSFKYPTVLLVRTGNAAHWLNRDRYWGYKTDTVVDGNSTDIQLPTFHFPGIGAEAAQLLADEPAVVGVGIDTPSIDAGNTKTFPTHVTLFAANKFGLEHVGDMSRVPATGATILALPMKIGGGSGGPCRVLVRLP